MIRIATPAAIRTNPTTTNAPIGAPVWGSAEPPPDGGEIGGGGEVAPGGSVGGGVGAEVTTRTVTVARLEAHRALGAWGRSTMQYVNVAVPDALAGTG